MTPAETGGPLVGVTVIELAGAGPVPFAATMLADLGARIIRIDRPGAPVAQYPSDPRHDVLGRGRESVQLDLKGDDRRHALRLVEQADVFLEGLRPGVAERLGIGPEQCRGRNPRLVYGRISGWGRTGPLAGRAGHDINFIAVGGVLAQVVDREGRPAIPLSLVGDYGGGGMTLAVGVLGALAGAARTGHGCVVDTSILDGAAAVIAPMWGLHAEDEFDDAAPGSNVADGGAPFYNVYRCRDGRYVAVGAIESAFRRRLAELLGTQAVLGASGEAGWAAERAEVETIFASRTAAQWCELFEGEDVCVSPVLRFSESATHPQFADRGRFVENAGVRQPRPPWMIDGADLPVPPAGPRIGEHTDAVLAEFGQV